jgi:hypothetical protein
MHTHSRLVAALGLAGVLAVTPNIASGQAPQTHHVVHRTAPTPDTDVVLRAPPPPPSVVRPPRPFPDAVWTDGYWSWNGHGFVWVDGAWVHPVPGRRWAPWRWDYEHGRWYLIRGGWVPTHEGHL